MIIRRTVLQQQNALRAAVSQPCLRAQSCLTRQSRRGLHHVPPLTHDTTFKAEGVPGLLSAEGFDLAWTQYQGLMVDKLNLLTSGTPDENSSAKTLLVTYARQPDMASLFNYASMAHNNHFFFSCLSPTPTTIPTSLSTHLSEDFSSLDTLRKEFIATANALFGPAFVWLVKTIDRSQYRILTTYLAGSPYPAAHYRRQPVDMSHYSRETLGGLTGADYARQTSIQNAVGAFGPAAGRQQKTAPGGIDLVPILCVNTWEHVYLRDWGVGGKREFLEAWWDKIDWNIVAQNAETSERRRGRL